MYYYDYGDPYISQPNLWRRVSNLEEQVRRLNRRVENLERRVTQLERRRPYTRGEELDDSFPGLSPGFFPFCMRTGLLPSSAEKNRLDLLLFNGSVPDPDPVSPRRAPGSDGSVQPPVDEVKGRLVLESVTVLQPPLQKQPVTSRTIPRFLIVIMGTTAPGQPPQSRQGRQPTGDAFGDKLLKPAVGSRADARQHHPLLPGGPQYPIQSPLPPQHQQVARVAASHVDHILGQDKRLQIGGVGTKQRQVRRPALQPAEGLVKPFDIPLRIAARGGDKTDFRPLRPALV